jgi:hypothetical protein
MATIEVQLQRPAEPLPFEAMQHTLAAIRGSRTRTRFVVPESRRGLPRLGLARRIFAPVAGRGGTAAGGPRDQLRRATRSCETVGWRRSLVPSPQRSLRARRTGPRWTHRVEGSLRHARPRSAAPWRA